MPGTDGIIDIHAHILPGIDDGSKNVKESIALIEESARQGVKLIAATSHFYAAEDSPESFLKKRKAAAIKLKEEMRPGMPRILLGAEVYYFDGISRVEDIARLQIGKTGYMMLEMPFTYWNERVINEVLALKYERKLKIILAHIERYMQYHQKKTVWEELRSHGILMQCNASFFIDWRTKRKAAHMLLNKEIDFVGSDCHNMTNRPPRLLEAYEMIDKMTGEKGRRMLSSNSQKFENEL